LRFGVFSNWMNSYWGGALAAAGGALVLGAFPRLLRRPSAATSVLLALGAMILANTRPFEGMVICLVVAAAFGIALLRGRLRAAPFARHIVVPALLIVVPAMALNLYYNRQTTGSALEMAHQANRARYSVIPYWVWQPMKPVPAYNHEVMRRFFTEFEAGHVAGKTGTWQRFLRHQMLEKLQGFALFFFTPALLIPIVVLFRVVPLRVLWFPAAVFATLYAGMLANTVGFLPHYSAPITSLAIALPLMGLRRIRVWRRHEGTGLCISRWLLASIAMMCAFQVCVAAGVLQPSLAMTWGSRLGGNGFRRAHTLEQFGLSNSLVFVRYAPDHDYLDEWVYNEADLENSATILVRDMGPEANRCVIEAYPGRALWLLQPDLEPPLYTPYTAR